MVIGVSGEDMQVVMPDVLVASGFVVLASGDAFAIQSFFHGEADLLCGAYEVRAD